MNVVCVRDLPPVGPWSDPMDCSSKQGIAPVFGQLGSDPAAIDCSVCPHTLLESNELCHVALPNATRFRREFVGVCVGAEKVGDDLLIRFEEGSEQCGFGTSVNDRP